MSSEDLPLAPFNKDKRNSSHQEVESYNSLNKKNWKSTETHMVNIRHVNQNL